MLKNADLWLQYTLRVARSEDDPRYNFWYATALAYKVMTFVGLPHSEHLVFYFLPESIQKRWQCLYGSYSATLGMVAFSKTITMMLPSISCRRTNTPEICPPMATITRPSKICKSAVPISIILACATAEDWSAILLALFWQRFNYII